MDKFMLEITNQELGCGRGVGIGTSYEGLLDLSPMALLGGRKFPFQPAVGFDELARGQIFQILE
jgi:hypothetical protein